VTKVVPSPFKKEVNVSGVPGFAAALQEASDFVTVRGGYTGDPVFMFVLPLLEPAGVLGMMACGSLREHTDESRCTLMMVANHASVRLAQLGVRRVREPSIESRLTSRQLEVAQLAARGRTNSGIGDALDMSENTVKKHLKDVFERLAVETRAELATVLLHAAPHEHVPIGITRRGHLTIVRAQ
jgi:DNA-binding CsgD family transcriptional regulator